jgi:hypothetical protein
MKAIANRVNRDAAKDAVVSGSFAAVLSAAALSFCSQQEEGSAAGGLNGPSQWLWGEEEAYTREATLKHTAVGYAIHHSTSIFWATFYEHLFGRGRKRHEQELSNARVIAEAAAMTAAAYIVDYKLTPKRFRPGFEKHISGGSMFAVYAAFGTGLALATLLRLRRDSNNEVLRIRSAPRAERLNH